eukprot:202550_1
MKHHSNSPFSTPFEFSRHNASTTLDRSYLEDASSADDLYQAVESPARRTLWEFMAFRYTVGNSPTVQNLIDDSAIRARPSTTVDPWRVLLCGCGDVRHVLQSAHHTAARAAGGGGALRLEFHLNDASAMIVARAVLLLVLAAREEKSSVDDFLAIWADMAISASLRRTLNALLDQLIAGFSESARSSDFPWLYIPSRKDRKNVIKVWRHWRSTKRTISEIQKMRQSLMQNRIALQTNNVTDFAGNVKFLQYLNRDILPTVDSREEMEYFYMTGCVKRKRSDSVSSLGNLVANPTVLDCFTSPEYCVHYDCNPFRTFNVQMDDPEMGGADAPTMMLYNRLHNTVTSILSSFRKIRKENRIKCTFHVCNVVHLPQRFEGSTERFDVIETSNLSDLVGLANLFVTLLPLLSEGNHARLLTESLKALHLHMSVKGYLSLQIGLDERMLGTVLGIRLHPAPARIISNRTSKKLGGRGSLCGFASALQFDWRRIPGRDRLTRVDLALVEDHSRSRSTHPALDPLIHTFVDDYGQGNFPYSEQMRRSLPSTLTAMTVLLCLENMHRFVRSPGTLLSEARDRLATGVTGGRAFILAFEIAVAMRLRSLDLRRKLPEFPLYANENSSTLRSLHRLRYKVGYISDPGQFRCPNVSLILVFDTNLEKFTKDAIFVHHSETKRLKDVWFNDTSRVQYLTNFCLDNTNNEIGLCLPADGYKVPGFRRLDYASTAFVLCVQLSSTRGVMQQFMHEPVFLSDFKSCEVVTKSELSQFPIQPDIPPLPLSSCGVLETLKLEESVDMFQAEVRFPKSMAQSAQTTLTSAEKGDNTSTNLVILHLNTPENASTLTFQLASQISVSNSVVQISRKRCLLFVKMHKTTVFDRQQHVVEPLLLPLWPSGREMSVNQTMFDLSEIALSVTSPCGAPTGSDAHFDLRQSICSILVETQKDATVPHFLSNHQDTAGAVLVVHSLRMMADGQPLLLCWWNPSDKSDPNLVLSLGAVVKNAGRGTGLHPVKCTDEELTLMLSLLESNARCLPTTKQYKGRYFGPTLFKLTYIAPMYTGDMFGEMSNLSGLADRKEEFSSEANNKFGPFVNPSDDDSNTASIPLDSSIFDDFRSSDSEDSTSDSDFSNEIICASMMREMDEAKDALLNNTKTPTKSEFSGLNMTGLQG